MNITIFYHIWLSNNWFDVVTDQINLLKNSNLYYNSEIRIGVLYNQNNHNDIEKLKNLFNMDDNVTFLFIKENDGFAESNTLKCLKLYSDSLFENCKILYIHTKGLSHKDSNREIPVREWRKMMEYFLIEKWENCIKKLDENYDCCGVNYQNHAATIDGDRKLIKIFNGNFFWVNSDYVKKLNVELLFEHRFSSENWITSEEHKPYSFYDTPRNINLYYDINEDYKK
jgi:hypothetical protein